MSDKRIFVIQLDPHPARQRAIEAVRAAEVGMVVEVKPATRTSGQNERFHAICSDIAKSGMQWAGKPRNAAQWKVLLVSGHAAATKEEFDMVPGLEGEYLNIRESTALMSVRRAASLIEYATAFATLNGVTLRDVQHEPA